MNKDSVVLRKIDVFVQRLHRIGIDITLLGNVPWIYIHTINGKVVTERYMGSHGFTIAFYPIRKDQELQFTDIGKIFELIRKYV